VTDERAQFLEVAVETAKSAGEIQRNRYEDHSVTIERKGRIDLVTAVDIACEKLIVSAISKRYPQHGILAEEGTQKEAHGDYLWIIDPLDGTTNYAHGFPMFAVSIALAMRGKPVVGVVYEPIRDELFTAVAGEGAMINGKPISVSSVSQMDDALLATGFPYDVRTNPANNLDNFKRVALNCQAVRRPGAAVLDLSYVACGRLDGFWEQRLYPWDMAAGSLIVAEAGGVVTDMDGKPLDLHGETIIAANPRIHPKLLALLQNLA